MNTTDEWTRAYVCELAAKVNPEQAIVDAHKAALVAEREKVKALATTGEWTIHHPLLASLSHNHAGKLAEAINASLVGERERHAYSESQRNIMSKMTIAEVEQLREQLASEQENSKKRLKYAQDWQKEANILRQQLTNVYQLALKIKLHYPSVKGATELIELCKP